VRAGGVRVEFERGLRSNGGVRRVLGFYGVSRVGWVIVEWFLATVCCV
jgi:hypothetical protein